MNAVEDATSGCGRPTTYTWETCHQCQEHCFIHEGRHIVCFISLYARLYVSASILIVKNGLILYCSSKGLPSRKVKYQLFS